MIVTILFMATSMYAGKKAIISDTRVNLNDLVLEIFGTKFTPGLKVMLDGVELEVLESNDSYIKAGLEEGMKTGSYKLVLTKGEQLTDNKKQPYFQVFIGELKVQKPVDADEGVEEAATPDDSKKEKKKKKKNKDKKVKKVKRNKGAKKPK